MPRPRGMLGRWVVHATFGEFVGFMVPMSVWGALATAGLGDAALYLPVVLAGAGEGAVLGWAQSRVLRDELTGFERGEWVRNTALAACVAWSLGMMPGMLSDSFGDRVPDVLLAIIGVSAVPVMLFSIGWAQSLVLRRHVAAAGRWVTVNALAWFAGLPFTFIALAAAPDDTAARIACAAIGGLAMAAVVALLTGLVLRGLIEGRSWREGVPPSGD